MPTPSRFRWRRHDKVRQWRLLDVWLLVRCVSCDRTSKPTVHERAPVRSFDPAELDGYRANDPELVARRTTSGLTLRVRPDRASLAMTPEARVPTAWYVYG